MVHAARSPRLGKMPTDRERSAAHRRARAIPEFARLARGGSPADHGIACARSLPGHAFWPDHISLLDAERIDASRLLSSGQVTDSYLLALACAHGGQLASFDRRLVTDAVRGGERGLHLIV